MDIGIIGAGNVGSVLARRLTEVGHQVTIAASSDSSPRLAEATTATGVAAAANSVDAVSDAELSILAVPFTALESALTAPVVAALGRSTLVDVTNPLGPDGLALQVGQDTSAGEMVAAMVPETNVVKAFNTILAPNHSRPVLGGVRQSVPVAGDDLAAKKSVLELGTQLGFDAVDAGPLTSARYLEPVAALLFQVTYGTGSGGPRVGLALARD